MDGRDAPQGLSRRGFLGQAAAGGVALTWPALLPSSASAGAPLAPCAPGFRNSLSVSPFIEAVLRQVSLSDGTRTARTMADAQRLFNAHGATEVYARIATAESAPSGDADSGWANGLTRARLARDLGMPFNPEIGLFGTYGDGATYQDPPTFDSYPSIRLPGPWSTLTLPQMLAPLREYAALVAKQILNTGVTVNFWDLGNEVENGISGVCVLPLFPTTKYQPPSNVDPLIATQSVPGFAAMGEPARIAFCRKHLWPYVGQLLAAARDGILSVDRNAKFSTHVSHFGQATPATQVAFWEVSRDQGYLPDQLGTSYYPTDGRTTFGANDTLGWFKDTATALGQKFGRPMFIAEYGYPSAAMPPPYPFNDQVPGYTIDESGQHAFTRELVSWGVATGRLAGLRPWAPDYCSASAWQPMSWFDVSGAQTSTKPVIAAVPVVVGPPSCAAPTQRSVTLAYLGRTRSGDVIAELQSRSGPLAGLALQLRHGGRIVAQRILPTIGPRRHRVVLSVPRRGLTAGSYRLTVTDQHALLANRAFRLPAKPAAS